MRSQKNKNTYIRVFCSILIDILIIVVIVTLGFGVYKIIYHLLKRIPNLSTVYGNLISAFVTILLTVISYTSKVRDYLLEISCKIKQIIYQLLSRKHNPLSALLISNYNEYHLSASEEQDKFISSAVHILKNNTKNMIIISGRSGRGKTTSVMLLLNAIAQDKELCQFFFELQNRIVYFDSVNNKDDLLEYLSHPEKQNCRLIIIDNIQKSTISSVNEVMNKVDTFSAHIRNVNKKFLIVLLYQETDRNNDLYEYIIKFFKKDDDIFKLNRYINLDTKKSHKYYSSQSEVFKENICEIDEPFFQQHMNNIFFNRKDDSIITFFNDLVFAHPTSIPRNKEKAFFVLVELVFVGLYNGYVTRKELQYLWIKNYSIFSLIHVKKLIRYYVRNRVLTPFPFICHSYIFNEQLARDYRKILIQNNFFREKSSAMAESMFLRSEECNPQKWIFFLLCSSDFCRDFPQDMRIRYFENTLSAFHLQYILDIIEAEISILPEKKDIFRQELGIIYIYNGEWVKAKQILYPYVQDYDINKDIWHIQLKIIEAEHGGSDDKYLEMLSCMETECSDPTILFQIRYWREHINMEHGSFSLNEWEKLVYEITSSEELKSLRTDEHFSIRVISDFERTYFLKGEIEYQKYQKIVSQYRRLNNKNAKNVEPIECTLSRAFYIQYDVLYQLGIWGYTKCGEIDPNIIRNPEIIDNSNAMNDLLQEALDKYDFCINKYRSEGKKKYRTLEVRRAELTLCIDSGNFIEVLNQYDNFEHYACQNKIKAFEGYCKTQKGKAFALYADHMLRRNDFDRFEEYLNKAEEYLSQAKKIYMDWGNTYGAFRAELLTILVNMVKDRDRTKPNYKKTNVYRNKYIRLLSNLTQNDPDHQYVREQNIIKYLEQNISKIDLPLIIFRFYPIILQ